MTEGGGTPLELTVRECRDCGRSMVIRSVLERDPALRRDYVWHAAHGMCAGCYSTAKARGCRSEPAARRVSRWITPGQPCRDCGRGLMAQAAFYRDAGAHRRYVPLGGHGMCTTCYVRARRAGTLPDPAPRKPVRRPIPAPLPVEEPIVGPRPIEDGPNGPDTVMRLRRAIGLAERHTPGQADGAMLRQTVRRSRPPAHSEGVMP